MRGTRLARRRWTNGLSISHDTDIPRDGYPPVGGNHSPDFGGRAHGESYDPNAWQRHHLQKKQA